MYNQEFSAPRQSIEWAAIRAASPHTRAGDLKTAPNAAAIELLYNKYPQVGNHWSAVHILSSAIEYLRTGRYYLGRNHPGNALGPVYPATDYLGRRPYEAPPDN